MRSIDFCRVQMYWAIGRRISEKVQQGKERADYGKYIIRNLSKNRASVWQRIRGEATGAQQTVL